MVIMTNKRNESQVIKDSLKKQIRGELRTNRITLDKLVDVLAEEVLLKIGDCNTGGPNPSTVFCCVELPLQYCLPRRYEEVVRTIMLHVGLVRKRYYPTMAWNRRDDKHSGRVRYYLTKRSQEIFQREKIFDRDLEQREK